MSKIFTNLLLFVCFCQFLYIVFHLDNHSIRPSSCSPNNPLPSQFSEQNSLISTSSDSFLSTSINSHQVQNVSKFLPSNFNYSHPPLNSDLSGVAVFLSTHHPNWFQRRFTYMVQNIYNNLPPNWKIQVFTFGFGQSQNGIDINRGLQRMIEKGEIILTLIPKEITSKKRKLMHIITEPWIWKNMAASRVLLFGGNSVICSNSNFTLDEFDGWDYLAAPWRNFQGFGGESGTAFGGMSLRNREAMLRVLEYELAKYDYPHLLESKEEKEEKKKNRDKDKKQNSFKKKNSPQKNSILFEEKKNNQNTVHHSSSSSSTTSSSSVSSSSRRLISSPLRDDFPSPSLSSSLIPSLSDSSFSSSPSPSSFQYPPIPHTYSSPSRNKETAYEDWAPDDMFYVSRMREMNTLYLEIQQRRQEDEHKQTSPNNPLSSISSFSSTSTSSSASSGFPYPTSLFSLPGPEVTRQFAAIRSRYAERGALVASGWLADVTYQERDSFLQYCPELKILFPSLHDPSCFGASPNGTHCATTICALEIPRRKGGC